MEEQMKTMQKNLDERNESIQKSMENKDNRMQSMQASIEDTMDRMQSTLEIFLADKNMKVKQQKTFDSMVSNAVSTETVNWDSFILHIWLKNIFLIGYKSRIFIILHNKLYVLKHKISFCFYPLVFRKTLTSIRVDLPPTERIFFLAI